MECKFESFRISSMLGFLMFLIFEVIPTELIDTFRQYRTATISTV